MLRIDQYYSAGQVWLLAGHTMQSYQLDRFLHTAILYFISYFQLQALQRLGKGSRSEVAALKREMAFQLSELAPLYATIIMSESDYENTHQDKKFFEGFYETTTEILLQAFPGTRRQVMLEEVRYSRARALELPQQLRVELPVAMTGFGDRQ